SEQDKIDKVKQRIVEKCGQKPCYDVVAYHPYAGPGYTSDQDFSDKQGRIAYFGLSAFKPVIDGISSTYGTLGKKSAFTEWNVTCWTGEKGLISAEHAMAVAEAQLVMSENENVILSNYHAFNHGPCGHFDKNEYDASSGDGLSIMGNAYRLTVPPDYNSVSSVNVNVNSPVQTVDLGSRCWAGEGKCNGDMGTFPIVSSYAMESGKKLVIVIFNRDKTKEADITLSLEHLKQYENSKLVKVSTLHANSFTDNKFIEKTSTAGTFSNLQVPPISITRLEIQQNQEPATTSPISSTDSATNQPLQTQTPSSTSSPAATTPTSTSYYGGYSTLTPSTVDYLPDTKISGSDVLMIFFSSGVTLTSALIIKRRVHKRFEDRVTDDS
ncbi:MAG: hypothetical protein ACOCXT_05900, partial [Candidatus Dojkabacteria bacterium]